MKPWADYLITGVRYGKGASVTKIDQVLVISFTLLSRSAPIPIGRERLIDCLHRGIPLGTALLRSSEWYKGRFVSLVEIEGVRYVKTTQEQARGDWLADLPLF